MCFHIQPFSFQRLHRTILLIFLVTLGGYDNGVHIEHVIPDRKSTSISRHEASVRNSDKNTNDARNAKVNKAPPNSGYATHLFELEYNKQILISLCRKVCIHIEC